MDNCNIIIPLAGIGRRMKSYGPKALITLANGYTVIRRQLEILHRLYPKSRIVLVIGFEADKIYREIHKHCKSLLHFISFVKNEHYEDTNVAFSIALGMTVTKQSNVLVVYGDLVFNESIFDNMHFSNESCILIDKKSQFDKSEVGVTIINDYVSRFSYGLPIKWAQMVYLTAHEAQMFKTLSRDTYNRRMFSFEILNRLMDKGQQLKAIPYEKGKIVEIDASKDIITARSIS